LVFRLYNRKVAEFNFSFVLVVLAGVSHFAPYNNLTVVVGEVNEKGPMEHKISYVLITV
jgi:hypothetical protein